MIGKYIKRPDTPCTFHAMKVPERMDYAGWGVFLKMLGPYCTVEIFQDASVSITPSGQLRYSTSKGMWVIVNQNGTVTILNDEHFQLTYQEIL